jgi:hypothetical protein
MNAPALSDVAAAVTTTSSSTVAHPMSVGDRSDTDVAEYTSDSSSGALAHELPVQKALPATVSSHLAEVSHLEVCERISAYAYMLTTLLNKHICALLACMAVTVATEPCMLSSLFCCFILLLAHDTR